MGAYSKSCFESCTWAAEGVYCWPLIFKWMLFLVKPYSYLLILHVVWTYGSYKWDTAVQVSVWGFFSSKSNGFLIWCDCDSTGGRVRPLQFIQFMLLARANNWSRTWTYQLHLQVAWFSFPFQCTKVCSWDFSSNTYSVKDWNKLILVWMSLYLLKIFQGFTYRLSLARMCKNSISL